MEPLSGPAPAPPARRPYRRWLFLAFVAVVIVFVMREVLDPFGDAPYLEIPHGNHSHYVPEDRDPNVPIDAFPTTPPGPDERILPSGRVVPIAP